MFFHNFKYTLKVLLKNKVLVFWAILWPLILGTLFYMAFSNMASSEKLDIINLGIVDNEYYNKNEYLKTAIDNLSNSENENQLFKTTYEDQEKLNEMLNSKKIDGYIYVDINEIKIIVKESNINQTIIKYVVDEIEEYQNLISDLVSYKVKDVLLNNEIPNYDQIINNIVIKINQEKNYFNNLSEKNMDYMMIEYYTLLAMACLYGALLSSEAIKNYLGNASRKGSRVNLAPIKRTTLIMSGFLATFIIQLATITSLLLYTIFMLKVDYGNQIHFVILLSLVGSIAGISLGFLVGSAPFKSDSTRNGIMNVIVMLGCFFAGMMGVKMKYVIDTNLPLINKLNPSNMITDGFYSLYYYDNLSRYYFNLLSLLFLTIIFIIISVYYLRRKKYDSI
ncbi:MAG: ABC transporter permease [Bacilli bacterium]|nr:ABC transporter permease [Bacilli bacterium]